jgi:hypothetical protein
MATGSYEGPLPMEGIPDLTIRRLSRGGGHGDLGGSLHVRKHARRRVQRDGKSGEATGMSEARSQSAPWEQNAHARFALEGASRGYASTVGPPKRSSSVVKRSVPRSSRAEPRLCGASTQRKLRQRTGNARGAGTRKSYGWQKSIGRIARLAHREIARSRGGTQGASRKEARSTA